MIYDLLLAKNTLDSYHLFTFKFGFRTIALATNLLKESFTPTSEVTGHDNTILLVLLYEFSDLRIEGYLS